MMQYRVTAGVLGAPHTIQAAIGGRNPGDEFEGEVSEEVVQSGAVEVVGESEEEPSESGTEAELEPVTNPEPVTDPEPVESDPGPEPVENPEPVQSEPGGEPGAGDAGEQQSGGDGTDSAGDEGTVEPEPGPEPGPDPWLEPASEAESQSESG